MTSKKIISVLAFLFILITFGQAFSATYTYDNANRLTGVDLGNGFTINYTYDAAGNRVSMSYNDVAAPTGSVTINGGAASTSSASVTLTLSATDNSSTVSQMRFSNDNAVWSAWEPYSTTKAWTLSENQQTL